MRHCLGLIVTNLLAYGTVAYFRRKQFCTEKRTPHYTRVNMLRAVELAEKVRYAASERGFMSIGYEKGVSSTLGPLPRLLGEFAPINRVEVDVESLPAMQAEQGVLQLIRRKILRLSII